jgi:ParB/RepB/Spo0J family partition protein
MTTTDIATPAPAGSTIVVDELVTDQGVYGLYDLARMRRSPDNRKRFNEAALQELAASIKAMGVAQPILIRPVTPTAEAPEEYEIVAGERRYRASIIAGLATIPALCRNLSDLDAAKIRILENLQREDPHPMEEAEGYQLLMLQHGLTTDQLVTELKKSRAYVYARLKLCALCTDVREQFLDDKISASTALLIARIPVPALQVRATKEILQPTYGSEPLSHRAATAHIQGRYMLKLSAATFEIKDSRLLPEAGACTKCPKRTGNQPEIFADIDADVCTDPDCFGEKRAAHGAALLAQATKAGVQVFEGEEGRDWLARRWNRLSPAVTADMNIFYFDRNAPDTKNSGVVSDYLRGDALPKVTAYVKKDDGTLTELFARAEIQAALEAAGACEKVEVHAKRLAEAKATNPAAAAKEDAERLAQIARDNTVTQENAYRLALYKQLRQAAAGGRFSLASRREFIKAVAEQLDLDSSLHSLYETDVSTDLDSFIDNADAAALQLLLVDLVLSSDLQIKNRWHLMNDGSVNQDDGFAAVVAMARHEGIDVDAIKSATCMPADKAAA